ncbi:polar amino acid ABC transporter, inner membrane subunit [Ancylobacter novellus DSM 506]|uniref:Polar amino acid ABC transporter, inner membrane subunit n=1 Tax=Ancylobacter novellus (strain ATCC 8093 / DSM 506 / JCM 20403 / CCM 1077 / IAM 12100 / NBRC 12443 / NCIMB 10456) TaxID=639283 RepID=D7A904_ANCN5|nr:amino acid ABC transporter permease [Ancylobacter novellus]ADH88709.1 polar amino acid ABC transporter, inner membrane subunit [Ancylobacter novellus DSM 506]
MSLTFDDGTFIRTEMVAPLPPPRRQVGAIGWMRENLFSSILNTVLTLVGLGLVLLIVPPLVRFMFIDAVWTGQSREACLAPGTGACWPFINAKLGQLIYGFYPIDQRWRPNIVFAAGAVLLVPLLVLSWPFKKLNAFLFFVIYPIVAFILLTGGNIQLEAFLFEHFGLLHSVFGHVHVAGVNLIFWADYILTALVVMAAIGGVIRLIGGDGRAAARATMWVFLAFGLLVLAWDIDFGLPYVETRQWGGLLVTLVIAVTGIVASLPLGIALALGRRSQMPIVRLLSVVFIEFWRGVPLITVLFFATYMLPLFLPQGSNPDGLLRALVGVALFSAAYMAEVIRGGLQAIPKGQYEGAMAVGLTWSQMMRLIILPQALTLVIPGIVNSFISLFKDTTLVLIVSIFDFLGQLRASFTDPNWASPVTLYTGFAFAGVVYFLFCFGMSRYSLFVERRLNTSHRH